jgi:hypothetical protein
MTLFFRHPAFFSLPEPESIKEFLPPVDQKHQSGKETIA